MTHTPLTERENLRAVDLIETAERSVPFCECGQHMIAVAHGNEIWLECSEHDRSRSGLQGLIARLGSYSHTRRLILELSTAS